MRRTSLTLLILALLVSACSSDDDQPVDAERISLKIVSGDRQVAPVAAAPGASQLVLPAGFSAVDFPDNLLPEPLVARIVVDGEPLKSLSTPSDPLGPSLVTLPSDVVVTYRVIQPTGVGQRHCGDSFISSAKPDADGLVTTYWERGTYAGECRMEVRLVVDGAPRVDTVFVAEFEPGPPARGVVESAIWRSAADSLDFSLASYYLTDVHGNELPWRVDASCCAHPRSRDEADPVDSRKLIADSAGGGTMWIISGADTLRTGVLTVVDTTYLGRAVRWMTADFPDTF